MIFPFVIELEQNVKATNEGEALSNIFTIIQDYLKSKSVVDFYKTENIIKFKEGFFGLNTNVFAIIDKGEFELSAHNGEYKLKYRFYMFWFFITSGFMSILFTLLSGEYLFGAAIFFVLVICNFFICLVRQQGVLNDLAYNINEAHRNKKKTTTNQY